MMFSHKTNSNNFHLKFLWKSTSHKFSFHFKSIPPADAHAMKSTVKFHRTMIEQSGYILSCISVIQSRKKDRCSKFLIISTFLCVHYYIIKMLWTIHTNIHLHSKKVMNWLIKRNVCDNNLWIPFATTFSRLTKRFFKYWKFLSIKKN